MKIVAFTYILNIIILSNKCGILVEFTHFENLKKSKRQSNTCLLERVQLKAYSMSTTSGRFNVLHKLMDQDTQHKKPPPCGYSLNQPNKHIHSYLRAPIPY